MCFVMFYKRLCTQFFNHFSTRIDDHFKCAERERVLKEIIKKKKR